MEEKQEIRVKKVKSAVPIYLAAAAFILYGLLFRLYTFGTILTGFIVAGIIGLISKAWFPAKVVQVTEEEKPAEPKTTGDEEVDTMLKEGRATMEKLRALNDSIRDAYITTEITRMEKAGKLIFDTVEANPERAGKIRRFLNYYLPTTVKLLESYRTLSSHGYQGENIRATLESIKSSMDMIATAFERQADGLFADENLDIATDIEVLESVLKSEGLKEN